LLRPDAKDKKSHCPKQKARKKEARKMPELDKTASKKK